MWKFFSGMVDHITYLPDKSYNFSEIIGNNSNENKKL